MRAHSMSINAEFEKPVSVDLAREAIDNFEAPNFVMIPLI